MHSIKILPKDNYRLPNVSVSTDDLIASVEEYLLNKLKKTVSPTQVDYLKDEFSGKVQNEVDYNIYGDAFDYYYFLTNFWKYYSYFKKSFKSNFTNIDVLDLGSGSGACSLAFLAILNERNKKTTVRLKLIDKSLMQMEKAAELLKVTEKHLKNLTVVLTMQKQDLRKWKSQSDTYDVILMGHMFSDTPTYTKDVLEQITMVLKPFGIAVIVERVDDMVNQAIQETLKNKFVSVNHFINRATREIPFRYSAYTIELPKVE